MEKITLNGFCRRLPLLVAVLICINLLASFTHNIEAMRIMRLCSLVAVLSYHFKNIKQKQRIILWILSVLIFRDVALLFYETGLGHRLYLFLGIIAYFLICFERTEIIKSITGDSTIFIFTLILITLNTFTLYKISEMIEMSFVGTFEPFLFYIYGGFMIVLGATAIIYNQIYNSDKSLAYVFFAICFLISDITSLFAYYFDVSSLFYVDKVAFVLGLGFFSYTVLETDRRVEEKEQFTMLSQKR